MPNDCGSSSITPESKSRQARDEQETLARHPVRDGSGPPAGAPPAARADLRADDSGRRASATARAVRRTWRSADLAAARASGVDCGRRHLRLLRVALARVADRPGDRQQSVELDQIDAHGRSARGRRARERGRRRAAGRGGITPAQQNLPDRLRSEDGRGRVLR